MDVHHIVPKRSKTERFYCPYPGCKRSFIDLWRLKVHYRADPDVRGSGRERGHGKELPACPKCRKRLERGRHHVNCSAGKAAPSQANRRLQRVPRASNEHQGSLNQDLNRIDRDSIPTGVASDFVLENGIFDNSMVSPTRLTPVENIQLMEPLFQQPTAMDSFPPCLQDESSMALSFLNGSCISSNEVPNMNITAGYAVFLRADSSSKPSVYFVPGETMEVSVDDPYISFDQQG